LFTDNYFMGSDSFFLLFFDILTLFIALDIFFGVNACI
jgi:hypothetical protein